MSGIGRHVARRLTRGDLDRCVRLLKGPAFVVNSDPLITTWGRRP